MQKETVGDQQALRAVAAERSRFRAEFRALRAKLQMPEPEYPALPSIETVRHGPRGAARLPSLVIPGREAPQISDTQPPLMSPGVLAASKVALFVLLMAGA